MSLNCIDPETFLDWINPEKIKWDGLSRNPSDFAIKLLKANPDKIDWSKLSENTNDLAIELLKANFDKIDWYWLSGNKNDLAIELLEANPDKVDWWGLAMNSNDKVLNLLATNPNKEYYNFFQNCEPIDMYSIDAVDYVKTNFDKMSRNSLKKFSKNPTNEALAWLKANPDKIDWNGFSQNPNDEALALLKANPEKINWYYFSRNPNIFQNPQYVLK
jgi:hypothetical protein